MTAHVILIEATDRLLAPYPEHLREAALNQLKSLGVRIELNTKVKEIFKDRVVLDDGRIIRTHTLIWAAGVKASPLADMLDMKLERGGRIPVTSGLEVIGRENVFAIGDIAHLINPLDNLPYPQISPVAIQQGILTAKNIHNKVNGKSAEVFQYKDRGIMATIGRRRAVAYLFNRVQLTGWFAWSAWLSLHLVWLIGFRNKASVLVNWAWNYLTYDRSVRVLIQEKKRTAEQIKTDQVAG
jgi:NADH dehydrogenase